MGALTDARVFVTGATGFIGSHLTRRLVAEGAEVHTLTSRVSTVFPERLTDLRGRVTLHEGSLNDRGAVDVVVGHARPSHVFHLGAYTHVGKSWSRVDECIQTNVQGTVHLLQALAETGYERFVNVGTSEIYGAIDPPFGEADTVDPISPYAVSKYAAERFCRMFHRSYGWPIVMIRPFNAYGPAQSPDRVIPEIIVRGLRGERLEMTQGTQTREFNYVEDLADGLVRAATEPGIEGELFNLGTGEDISMRDLASLVLDIMGNPITPEFGALAERPTEIPKMVSDPSRARERLGWRPEHTLREGLERTVEWYRDELASPGSTFVP